MGVEGDTFTKVHGFARYDGYRQKIAGSSRKSTNTLKNNRHGRDSPSSSLKLPIKQSEAGTSVTNRAAAREGNPHLLKR
ncbi:hypothetical protein OH492_13015 [Vibrio chagasii]|nr:hypothetical protein [Vibrio chagasii]